MEIPKKVVVITGGAQGIGFAMAQHFADLKAKVVIADVVKGILDEAVSKIKEQGGEAHGIICDVSKEKDAENLMRETVEKYE